MVPLLKEKIIDSLDELESFVEDHKDNDELKEHENFAKAVEEIELTQKLLLEIQEKEEQEETGDQKADTKQQKGLEDEDQEMSISD